MTLALIATNPYAIISIFSDGTTEFRLPDGGIVDGAQAGWTGDGYAVVEVVPFTPPTGQQIVGAPTYAVDDGGSVTQTYATEPIPPPPSIQIVSTSTPALNGSYALSMQQQMAEVAEYVAVNGKFPDGLTAFPVPDIGGTVHSFLTTASFMAFVSAMGDYVTALDLGQTPTQPSTIP